MRGESATDRASERGSRDDERVSRSMPEFEMPTGVEEPPRPRATSAPTTVRPVHTADPDASDALEPARRAGLGWRHLLIAAVLGAVVGAAIPGGVQLAERAAATDDAASLRAVATDYLTAIADGRAGDATALVPLTARAEALPDAVLQSARRIDEVEVLLVHIDGDAATVEVRYRVGSVRVARTLDASRVEGEWWLTTSLAEPVEPMWFSFSSAVRIAGAVLQPGRTVHLYPGIYEIDEVRSPLLVTRSEPFSVDGSTATTTELYVDAQLAPEVAARADSIALAVAAACQAEQACPIAADADIESAGSHVYEATDDAIEVSAQIMTMGGQMWHEVRMRVVTDERGMPTEWRCASLGSFERPADPCPEVP